MAADDATDDWFLPDDRPVDVLGYKVFPNRKSIARDDPNFIHYRVGLPKFGDRFLSPEQKALNAEQYQENVIRNFAIRQGSRYSTLLERTHHMGDSTEEAAHSVAQSPPGNQHQREQSDSHPHYGSPPSTPSAPSTPIRRNSGPKAAAATDQEYRSESAEQPDFSHDFRREAPLSPVHRSQPASATPQQSPVAAARLSYQNSGGLTEHVHLRHVEPVAEKRITEDRSNDASDGSCEYREGVVRSLSAKFEPHSEHTLNRDNEEQKSMPTSPRKETLSPVPRSPHQFVVEQNDVQIHHEPPGQVASNHTHEDHFVSQQPPTDSSFEAPESSPGKKAPFVINTTDFKIEVDVHVVPDGRKSIPADYADVHRHILATAERLTQRAFEEHRFEHHHLKSTIFRESISPVAKALAFPTRNPGDDESSVSKSHTGESEASGHSHMSKAAAISTMVQTDDAFEAEDELDEEKRFYVDAAVQTAAEEETILKEACEVRATALTPSPVIVQEALEESPTTPLPSKNLALLAELKKLEQDQGIQSLNNIKEEQRLSALQKEAEAQERLQSLKVDFAPEKFVDRIPKITEAGDPIPDWKRLMLAKKLATEAAKKEEERIREELENERKSRVPIWKQASVQE